jgi:hypothetical protein
MRADEMLESAPSVALHKLLGQILVLISDSFQQRRHLRLQFRSEAIETVEIEEKMEVGHCLRGVIQCGN